MSKEYIHNRQKLIDLLEPKSMMILDSGTAPHQTTDQFYHYTPHRNMFYLTGLSEPNVRLMIVKGKKQFYTFLFIEETTEYMRKWVGEKISKEQASEISGVDASKIFYLSQFDSMVRNAMQYTGGFDIEVPDTLYLDLYRYHKEKPPVALEQFQAVLSNYVELNVKSVDQHLSYLRMFKSEQEVKQIQSAIDITKLGLERVMRSLKTRSNEFQIAADFHHEIVLNGSEGNSFNTIAASGINATVLHYEDNNAVLQKDELFLCDLGALYQNYASDISRTYPILGTFTERQKQLYSAVLMTNKKTIEFVKPGITWTQLNKFAKETLGAACKEIGLIKEIQEVSKYYTHSIGHFLGLDVHDVGQYDKELLEGMVITIEPGLYIKEEGIGIRIEDNILITKDGSINLSKDIIKEIEDIEKYMS